MGQFGNAAIVRLNIPRRPPSPLRIERFEPVVAQPQRPPASHEENAQGQRYRRSCRRIPNHAFQGIGCRLIPLPLAATPLQRRGTGGNGLPGPSAQAVTSRTFGPGGHWQGWPGPRPRRLNVTLWAFGPGDNWRHAIRFERAEGPQRDSLGWSTA